MERERPLVLCVVVLCCSAESLESGRDPLYYVLLFCVALQSFLLESQLMEAQMER